MYICIYISLLRPVGKWNPACYPTEVIKISYSRAGDK